MAKAWIGDLPTQDRDMFEYRKQHNPPTCMLFFLDRELRLRKVLRTKTEVKVTCRNSGIDPDQCAQPGRETRRNTTDARSDGNTQDQ
jgi:hypothetical protein